MQLLESLERLQFNVFRNWNSLTPVPRNPAEQENTFLSYGTSRCKEYITTLEEFTEGISHLKLLDTAQITNHLTRGAHGVNKATKEFMDKTSHVDIVNVECGSASISKQISESQRDFENLVKQVELDIYQKNSSACGILQLTNNQTENLNSIPTPQLLNDNYEDFKYVFENPLAMDLGSKLDRVRQRLLSLVIYSKDPSFEINMQSNQLMANAAFQQYNVGRYMMNPNQMRPQYIQNQGNGYIQPANSPSLNWRPPNMPVSSDRRCLNCGNPAQPSANGIHMCQGNFV